jgi:hypothetical protein
MGNPFKSSPENKMKALQEFANSLRRGEGGVAIPKLLYHLSKPTSLTKSTPMSVDVSAEGMKKKSKTLARGTGVTYSGVKTSSQGLLTGAKTEKKTLLGG